MTVSILFASLALLIILNVPVGIALGISSMLAIIMQSNLTNIAFAGAIIGDFL